MAKYIYINKTQLDKYTERAVKGRSRNQPNGKPPGQAPRGHTKSTRKNKKRANNTKNKRRPPTPHKRRAMKHKEQPQKLTGREKAEATTPTPKQTEVKHHQTPTESNTEPVAPPTHDKCKN